ncbi:MAG: hypothetical protein P1U34_10560 [Coxiellaceae bacterium]|nr:hypothetical protein [Coxiellaceae bacterium]
MRVMTPIAIELVRDGFHMLDKSPRRLVEPARQHTPRLNNPEGSDKAAAAAIIPLFNKLIAPQQGAGQDIAGFVASKYNEPVDRFRTFYTAYSRAMLHKFAECCQRQAMGENVDNEITDLKRLYQAFVETPAYTARGAIPSRPEQHRYQGDVYFSPADVPNADAFYAGCDALFKPQLDTDAQPLANPAAVPPVPAPEFQHFVVPAKSASALRARRQRLKTPSVFWQSLSEKVNDDLRGVTLARLTAILNKYTAQNFQRIFSRLTVHQQVHLAAVLNDPKNVIAIPQASGDQLQLNCLEALIYAAKQSQQAGADQQQMCRIANMALKQLLPDETIVLSLQRSKTPAAGVSNPPAANLPLWRNAAVVDPAIAGHLPSHGIADVVAREEKAVDEPNALAQRVAANPIAAVYVGTPAQVGAGSELVKQLDTVAIGGDVLLADSAAELKLGPADDQRLTYTPAELDAALVVDFRRQNSPVHHYQGAPRGKAVGGGLCDVRWIPGTSLVPSDDGLDVGKIDQEKFNAAVATAVGKKGGYTASRIITVVQINEEFGDPRYVTIAIDVVNNRADAVVIDPYGEKAGDAKAIKAAIKTAVEALPPAKSVTLVEYKTCSEERAAAYESMGEGDDGVWALRVAEMLSVHNETITTVNPDLHPPVDAQERNAKAVRRDQFARMKRVVNLTDEQRHNMITPLQDDGVTANPDSMLDASGKLTQDSYQALVRPLRYQTAVLPDPTAIGYPGWVETEDEQKSFEVHLLQHNIANLYFLLAQGKQVNLPAKNADGHYQLEGMAADSWMHKHQAFIDSHLDRFAALAHALHGANHAAQRAALMQLHDDKEPGYLAYVSAFIAGESSDAIGLDPVHFDAQMQADVKAASGAVVEHMHYQPQTQPTNAVLCSRTKGEHLLSIDERAMEEMRSQHHRRSIIHKTLNLQQSIKMTYAMLFKAADRTADADYDRFETKLRELLGDDGFDRLMLSGVNAGTGSLVIGAAEIDACFAEAYGRDSTSKQRALAIKAALLKPDSVGPYYGHLVRTIGNELQVDIKDEAKLKLPADDVEFDSLEDMFAAHGGSPDLYGEFPQAVLCTHLKNVAGRHNDSQDDNANKTDVVLVNENGAESVEDSFDSMTRQIRDYLNATNPDQGQKFFHVYLKAAGSGDGHFVWVAVNHKHKRVWGMDSKANTKAFDPDAVEGVSEVFAQRLQRLQHDLQQPDLKDLAPAVENVTVVNISQSVDGLDGLAPQKTQVTCGEYVIAALDAVMKHGEQWCANAAAEQTAEAKATAVAESVSLGPVPEPHAISSSNICKSRVRAALDGMAGVVGLDGAADLTAAKQANLAKLTTLNPSSWYAGPSRGLLGGKAYGDHELELAAQLLTDAKLNVSALDDIPADALDVLVNIAGQYTAGNAQVAQQLRELAEREQGNDAVPQGFVVGRTQVESQRTSLLAKNKQEVAKPQWQGFFSRSAWQAVNVWNRLRQSLTGPGAILAKKELSLALVTVCAEAGIDLSKVTDLDQLPDSVKHTMRHAAHSLVCRVITAADLAEKSDLEKQQVFVNRNQAEFNDQTDFWLHAVSEDPAVVITKAEFENVWLPRFNQSAVDLAALRSDPKGDALLSHFVSACKQLQRVGLDEGTPYAQRQQLQGKFTNLAAALHNYQHAARESAAYSGDDVAEQQRLLDAIDTSHAQFKDASVSYRQQVQQTVAARNRHYVTQNYLFDDAPQPLTDFQVVMVALSEPAESTDLYVMRLLNHANKQGIDLTVIDWDDARNAVNFEGFPVEIKTLSEALKQVTPVPGQAPSAHTWHRRPMSSAQWEQYKVDWQQQLTTAHAAKIKPTTTDFSNADFKRLARAAANALHQRPAVAGEAAVPTVFIGNDNDERLADIPALKQANIDRLNALSARLPVIYSGAAGAARREVLADFATAMRVDLNQVRDSGFDTGHFNSDEFLIGEMQQLMQLAEPYMVINGGSVDQSVSPSVISAMRERINASIRGDVVLAVPAADLLTRNTAQIEQPYWRPYLNEILFEDGMSYANKQLLQKKFVSYVTAADIDLAELVTSAGEMAASRTHKRNAIQGLMFGEHNTLSNQSEVLLHKAFYVSLCQHANPVVAFDMRQVTQPGRLDYASRMSNRLRLLADKGGIDLVRLRSTQTGMQVLNQWMQGVNVAAYQCYLSGEAVNSANMAPRLLHLSQDVVQYQAHPELPHCLQDVKASRQALVDDCKLMVTEFNQRILVASEVALQGDEQVLRQRIDAFINAPVVARGEVVNPERAKKLRSKLVAFLNAHGRSLPALDQWPVHDGAAINVNAFPALSNLLTSAATFYDACFPAGALGNMTVASLRQRAELVRNAAASTVALGELALIPIARDLDDVYGLADEVIPLAKPADADAVVSNDDHLAYVKPAAASNSDNWWGAMLKTRAGQGFVLSGKDAWMGHLKAFCGDQINLNQLASLRGQREFPQVVQQMLRVMIQQQHGIYPSQSQAAMAAYKKALASYIASPNGFLNPDAGLRDRIKNDTVLQSSYRELSRSVPAVTPAAPGPRHPRLQAHLQQLAAQQIFEHKALDTFLQRQYPDAAVDAGQLDLLRMQVVQYMQKFGITRFDFPTEEICALADTVPSDQQRGAYALVSQWKNIARYAVAYDATLIAGRRLGVTHDEVALAKLMQGEPRYFDLIDTASSMGSAHRNGYPAHSDELLQANMLSAATIPEWKAITTGDYDDKLLVQQVVDLATAAGIDLSTLADESKRKDFIILAKQYATQSYLAYDQANCEVAAVDDCTFVDPAIPAGPETRHFELAAGTNNSAADQLDAGLEAGKPKWHDAVTACLSENPSLARIIEVKTQLRGFAESDARIDLRALQNGEGAAARMRRMVSLAMQHVQAGKPDQPVATITDNEKDALLLREIEKVMPIPVASLARVFAQPGQSQASLAEVKTQLLSLFQQNLTVPPALADNMQPHALLAELNGQDPNHTKARAHIIRAVLLTQVAKHAGVTLQNAVGAELSVADVLQSTRHQIDVAAAFRIAPVRDASQALLTAYKQAAQSEPVLNSLLVPAVDQPTAAERLARRQTQAGRPNVYEGTDPQPGTAEFRHQVLQQMRHDAAAATGGVNAQALPKQDITDVDDLEALRRRSAVDRQLDSEKDLLAQQLDRMRLDKRFCDADGKVEASVRDIFVKTRMTGRVMRRGFEKHPEDHPQKYREEQQTYLSHYVLDETKCTSSELYFSAPAHTNEHDFKLTRTVDPDNGSVRFKVSLAGNHINSLVNPQVLADLYAAALAREFYTKDKDGNWTAKSIDVNKFKPDQLFGKGCGVSQPDAIKMLKEGFKKFHDTFEVKGEMKVNFADEAKPAPPKPAKEQKQAPVVNNEATRWFDAVQDQFPAEERAQTRQALANATDQQRQQVMAVPADQRVAQLRAMMAKARQQQAQAGGAQQPPRNPPQATGAGPASP